MHCEMNTLLHKTENALIPLNSIQGIFIIHAHLTISRTLRQSTSRQHENGFDFRAHSIKVFIDIKGKFWSTARLLYCNDAFPVNSFYNLESGHLTVAIHCL
jgi:hypothetical protein